jgi:Na+/melibiose symporter-like transporter
MNAQPAAATAPAPLGLLTKLFFGLGQGAESVLFTAFETFVLFYYTRVLGLPGAMAGTALLLALVIDALFDPIFGLVSDGLHSRFGRRHGPMFLSVAPAGLGLALLFGAPQGLSDWALFAWLLGSSALLRTAFTLFFVPYQAQHAELTASQSERAWMSTARTVISTLSNLAFLYLVFQISFKSTPEYPRGQENAAAYHPFGIALALAIMAFMLFSALGTWRRMKSAEAHDKTHATISLTGAFVQLGQVLTRDRNTRVVIGGALVFITVLSAGRGLSLHLGDYFWKFDGKQIRIWQQSTFYGSLLMVFSTPFLVRRLGARTPWISGLSIYVLFSFLPVLLALIGAFDGIDTQTRFVIVCMAQAMAGMGMGMNLVCAHVVTAQMADEYAFITGATRAGLVFGVLTLTQKIASGLGKFIGGIVLQTIHFPSDRKAVEVAPSIVTALGWSQVIVIAGFGSIGVLIYSRYRLSAERRQVMVAALGRT